jgi:hypothetical protein
VWPTPQDYNEAVQMPDLAFSDADLRQGTPQLNALGLPKPVSGSFASVYQLHTKVGQQWAVRCFLRNVPHQEARYAHISEHLHGNSLEFMVPFEFIRKGILVSGHWFPILKMQWVSGTPLIEWVERHVDDIDALGSLQNSFIAMCRALAAHDIAHGDFQHGNILISDGKPKLVDYDGIYVPALATMGGVELGHRHYQHPRRSSADFDTYLDNFSAWSIWTSLRCIEQDPRLWRKLGCGEECLLFRQEDYADPSRSVAFAYLEQHESEVIREASRTMRRLLTLEPRNVPPLGEPIVGGSEPEAMPPLAVPGVSLDAGGLMSNLRAAVAAASAPTMVATKPQLKLVVDEPDAAQQAAQNISPWYLQPNAAAYLNVPVHVKPSAAKAPAAPPPPSPPKRASKKFGMLGRIVLVIVLWSSMAAVRQIMHPFNAPASQNHTSSAPLSPGSYAVIESPAEPISAKLAPDSDAVWSYKTAYQIYTAKNYPAAYSQFAHARTLNWYIDFDKSLCSYMMAQCVIAQGGVTLDAESLLQDALEGCEKYKFWIPSLATQLATEQMKLHKPGAAAAVLMQDLRLDNTTARGQKLYFLRQAALQTMQDHDPAGGYWYTKFVDETPKNAALPFNVFQDLRNQIRQDNTPENRKYAISIAMTAKQLMQRRDFAAADPRSKIFEQEFEKAITQLSDPAKPKPQAPSSKPK